MPHRRRSLLLALLLTPAAVALGLAPHGLRGARHDVADRRPSEAALISGWGAGNMTSGIIHHADAAECDAQLKVPVIMPVSDIGVRHMLYPGANLIVEIGGNVGQDTAAFLQRFPGCKIEIYEPLPVFCGVLRQKFASNPNVVIHDVGASDADGVAVFNVDGEASSGLNSTGKGSRVQVHLRDINAILTEVTTGMGRVPDVVSVNCEGCEYAVLQRMIDTGWLGKVRFIQMSWHIVDGVTGRLEKRCRVEQSLRNLYKPAFYSMYGWQGWELL